MSMETFPSNQMDTWSRLRRYKETICLEVGNIIFDKKMIDDHDAVELMTTNPNKEKRRNHW